MSVMSTNEIAQHNPLTLFLITALFFNAKNHFGTRMAQSGVFPLCDFQNANLCGRVNGLGWTVLLRRDRNCQQ
jgi:hypothetical protein